MSTRVENRGVHVSLSCITHALSPRQSLGLMYPSQQLAEVENTLVPADEKTKRTKVKITQLAGGGARVRMQTCGQQEPAFRELSSLPWMNELI